MNGFPHQKNKVDKGFPISPRHLVENLLTWALLKLGAHRQIMLSFIWLSIIFNG